MNYPARTPLRDRTRGRWHGILPAFGIHPQYLTGKNGPCPMCGGKDRWRFLDTDGNGTWICTHCGSDSGINLVMLFTGMPFREAAPRIESIIGDVKAQAPRPEQDQERVRAKLRTLWQSANPVSRGDTTDRWLRSRGIELDLYPPCLRTGKRVRYYNDDLMVSSNYPAMLAIVRDPDGAVATIHRTYLTFDGNKAPVEKPRKLFSSIPKGSAVRLTASMMPIMGIAEGIETALAASRLFGIPTWSVICARGIETFEPPPITERLVIFADHDLNHVGQKAAETLAARLSSRMQIEVKIPQEPGDWNNVLLAKERQ